jgi:hypothetical protein
MTRQVDREACAIVVVEGPPHLAGEWWKCAADLVMEQARHRALLDELWLDRVEETVGLRRVATLRREMGA